VALLSENQKENNDNMHGKLLDKFERDQEFLSKVIIISGSTGKSKGTAKLHPKTGHVDPDGE
jgi:hypothetical protein